MRPEVPVIAWLWLAACGTAPDADGDGFTAPTDCDDADPAVHPGAPELCDGLDQDCDARPDDAAVSPAPCLTAGVCAQGAGAECVDGAWSCTYQSPDWQPVEDRCDGLDNDCDGAVDDAVLPPPAFACDTDGECALGATAACVAGAWSCAYASLDWQPVEDRCDGLDNDCDGTTDLDLPPPPTFACATAGVCAEGGTAECSDGTWLCAYASLLWEPTEITCDGLDNDCDGAVDVGALPPAEFACLSSGVCGEGSTEACTDGAWSCLYASPSHEPDELTCDGLDNDCDDVTDETTAPADLCSAEGVCGEDAAALCLGASGWACAYGSPSYEPDELTCDGLDNDCDAVADEGLSPDCADLACGPDPVCGQSCGSCDPGLLCLDGACVDSPAWWGLLTSVFQATYEDIRATADGGLAIGGNFSWDGALDWTLSGGPPTNYATGDGDDGFALRLEPTGEIRFAVHVSGPNTDFVFDAVELPDGRFALVGSFKRVTRVGQTSSAPLDVSALIPNDLHEDGFLAVVDAAGVPEWVQVFGDNSLPATSLARGKQVVGLPDGAVAVLAWAFDPTSQVVFGAGTPQEVAVTVSSARQVVAAVYESDGVLRWAATLADGTEQPIELLVDPDGALNVLTSGNSGGRWFTVDAATGAVLRTVDIGTDAWTWASDVAWGADGEAYLSGRFISDTLGIGEPNETVLAFPGSSFIARYATDGALAWAKTVSVFGGHLGLADDGRIALIGITNQAPASIDAGSAVPELAEFEPGDDATDDEVLLTWWTADGAPDGYTWVLACDGLYSYKDPRVFPSAGGVETVTSEIGDVDCDLLLPGGTVTVGQFNQVQTLVARDVW